MLDQSSAGFYQPLLQAVIGHVIDVNPAHAVRGPKYVVKRGKTPVLTADEACELLDSIPIERNTARDGEPEKLEPALVGLRDRALIAVMVYSFARINAVLEMKKLADMRSI